MPTIDKQMCTCSTCGHRHNIALREIALFTGMVDALFKVYKWCRETYQSSEIKREHFKHLFKNENQSARFADWVDILPSYITKSKPGYYTFDLDGIGKVLRNEITIPCRLLKNPVTGEIQRFDYQYVKDVPNLGSLVNEMNEYVARYQPQSNQQTFF